MLRQILLVGDPINGGLLVILLALEKEITRMSNCYIGEELVNLHEVESSMFFLFYVVEHFLSAFLFLILMDLGDSLHHPRFLLKLVTIYKVEQP
jgi:hypothetical protein